MYVGMSAMHANNITFYIEFIYKFDTSIMDIVIIGYQGWWGSGLLFYPGSLVFVNYWVSNNLPQILTASAQVYWKSILHLLFNLKLK